MVKFFTIALFVLSSTWISYIQKIESTVSRCYLFSTTIDYTVIPSNGFNRQVNGYNVLNKVIVMCVLHYAKVFM